MATPPTFSSGAVLTAAQMNAVGLWLIKTQTVGSAVSSVTVTNAFSVDYDNYLIIMSGGTGSSAASMGMEIGGSATGYYGFMTYGDATTNTVQGAGRNNHTVMSWVGGCEFNTRAAYVSVQVINPFKNLFTEFVNGRYQNGNLYGTLQGEHRVATAYTSFKIVPDAGTITGGTIFVYGYKGLI